MALDLRPRDDLDRIVASTVDGSVTGRECLNDEWERFGDKGRLSDGLVPVQLRAGEPGPLHDVDHPFRRLVAEHADRGHLGREALDDVGHPQGSTWRVEPGANTKPIASAPIAIARSASSSDVMPQILTNSPLLANSSARIWIMATHR